jgi:hypothetical protein
MKMTEEGMLFDLPVLITYQNTFSGFILSEPQIEVTSMGLDVCIEAVIVTHTLLR